MKLAFARFFGQFLVRAAKTTFVFYHAKAWKVNFALSDFKNKETHKLPQANQPV